MSPQRCEEKKKNKETKMCQPQEKNVFKLFSNWIFGATPFRQMACTPPDCPCFQVYQLLLLVITLYYLCILSVVKFFLIARAKDRTRDLFSSSFISSHYTTKLQRLSLPIEKLFYVLDCVLICQMPICQMTITECQSA